jgi:hypothetical protein
MSTQTTPPTDLDPFESRLLDELRREVTARADAPRPRRTRRRALAVAAGVAATAMVGVVLVPGLGTTRAYSVQEGNSGEIEVQINRPEDAAGLERALESHGIEADVTYLPALQTCAPGRYATVDRDLDLGAEIGEDRVKVTLGPDTVRPGETFVFVWSIVPMTAEELEEISERDGVRTVSGARSSVELDVATGPVGACDVEVGRG